MPEIDADAGEAAERFEMTNTGNGIRVIYSGGRPVQFMPGQTRAVWLRPSTAHRLNAGSMKMGSASFLRPSKEREAPAVEHENNPVAIEALAAQAENGEIEWHEFQKAANVFLPTPMPTKKADIIEALKARAAELRKS